MKIRRLFLLLVWIPWIHAQAQQLQNEIDSLVYLLDILNPDTLKVQVLHELSDKTRRIDLVQSRSYAEEALTLAEVLQHPPSLGFSWLNMGKILDLEGEKDSAIQVYEKCLAFSEAEMLPDLKAWTTFKLGELYLFRSDLAKARTYLFASRSQFDTLEDTEGRIWNENSLGLYYAFQDSFPASNAYFRRAISLAEAANTLEGQAAAVGNMGINFSKLAIPESSLVYYYRSLEINNQVGDKRGEASIYLNIGNIYKEQNDIEMAKQAFQRSLAISREIGFTRNIGNSLNVLGEVFRAEKAYDSALIYFDKSLEVKAKTGNLRAYSNSLWNKAKLFQVQALYDDALKIIDRLIRLRDSIGYKNGLAGAYFLQGETYNRMGDYQKALSPLLKSFDIAREISSISREEQVTQELAISYAELGDYEQAFIYQDLYNQAKDSIMNEARMQQLLNIEALYNFEKKQAEIVRLEARQAKQELALKEERSTRNVVLAAALLVLVIGISAFRVYRNRLQKKDREKALALERERASRLEQIDQLKDQFLANTSHELRTPLHGIIGIAEALQDQVKDLDQQQNLNMVVASGKRLSALVNDLLDFSKIKNRDIDLNLKNLDLRALTDLVLKACAPLVKGKQLHLINALPENLPPILGDENRLQQVLYNLIGNSMKFTEEGKIVVGCLSSKAQATYRSSLTVPPTRNTSPFQGSDGESCVFFVADSGIGIPESKRDVIFQEFEQGDGSISREFAGTGLGLSISRKLIGLHGGEMWVESELGKGTVFYFSLPFSDGEEAPTAGDSGEMHTNAQAPWIGAAERERSGEGNLASAWSKDSRNELRVLIVDDEPINHKVLENYLSPDGFLLDSALNGREALQKLDSERTYDLVLLDIMMPKMSGYELCQEIRKRFLPSELPVIMVTAKNQVADLVKGLDTGANDYLSKPFTRDEFMARIKTHLNLHRIHRATGKFVPHEIIRALGRAAITDVKLGDQIEKEVTIFFSDIRDYTSLAEQLSPRDTFSLVNAYAYRLGPIIRAKRGFVSDYLGDGIVALFPEKVDEALEAAIDMQQAINGLNKERIGEGLSPISVGMGLHTGPSVMGIIGDEERNDAATISDAVNTASRIEGLTKYFGTQVLFSGETLLKMRDPNAFHYRYLGKFQLKGKQEPVSIYECLDVLPEERLAMKLQQLDTFEAGLKAYYNQHFYDAIDAFRQILRADPQDLPAQRLREKALQLLTDGVPEEWNGIEVLDSK